jgi:hypothetical protein
MEYTKEIQINGSDYQLIRIPARKKITIMIKLLKYIGMGFGKDKDIVSDIKTDNIFDSLHIESFLSNLAEKIDDNDVLRIISDLVSFSKVKNGEKWENGNLDAHFEGERFIDLIELIAEIFKFNYSDFFGKVTAFLPNQKAVTE